MNRAFLLLTTLALLAAGCVKPPADDDANDNTTGDGGMTLSMLPAPIDDSKQVTGSADPAAVPTGAPCSSPSAQCFNYPFTLNGTANILADLTWTLPASDFDFYVMQEGTQVISGANALGSPPGTSEHMEGELEEGDYEIVVVAWSVAQDTFTLHAEFSGGNMTESDDNSTLPFWR